ncbi:MAG: hypothetical protein V4582_23995, partial [Pseudomonadota bacterium]
MNIPSHGAPVYDGYDEFYRSLPHRVFEDVPAREFKGIKGNAITWRGNKLRLADAIFNPGEFSANDPVGQVKFLHPWPGQIPPG